MHDIKMNNIQNQGFVILNVLCILIENSTIDRNQLIFL